MPIERGAGEIVAGKLRLAKMKVMVDVAKGREGGEFFIGVKSSAYWKFNSRLPLMARWCASRMKNLSPLYAILCQATLVPISPLVLSLFSFPGEERRSFAEPLTIKFDGKGGGWFETETYFAVESSDYIGTFIHVVEVSIPSLTVTLLREAI